MRDLFANGAQPAPSETYDYTDENGELLYQIIRRHPKGFSARRPDGSGGWINDLEGVRRVAYRLPEILVRRNVFITEGEKDANTLHDKLRLPATTNVFGAGKWGDEYNHFFAKKMVYLIPDSDEAGEMHMRSVAVSLFGTARVIKILHLPFGKDAAEWFALGGTREQLVKLAKASPVVTDEQIRDWRKPAAGTNGLQFKPLGELMRQPTEKRRWVVDGLLLIAGTSLAAAKPKVGKSTFVRGAAFAVSRGEDFLGRKTKQGTVLYLAPQELEDEVKDHFKRLGATGSEPIYVCCRIDSSSPLDELERLIELYKPVLVIIDQLFHVLNIHSELSYAEVTKALMRIEKLARATGAHILMTYHMGKSERIDSADQVLGTTAFFAGVDTLLMLEQTQRYRTIESRQRYKGPQGDLPETVIAYDEARGAVTLGASRDEAEEGRVATTGHLATKRSLACCCKSMPSSGTVQP
jgi:hypothetical protein